jgi:hypothetical protein
MAAWILTSWTGRERGDGLCKEYVMRRDSWRDVKISCDKPRVWHDEEPPIKYEAPRTVTEIKVKQMMKAHFPEGPRSAQHASHAHSIWRIENIGRRVEEKTRRDAAAERWERFCEKVEDWSLDQEIRGVMHGKFDYGGADFNGLDRVRQRGRSI